MGLLDKANRLIEAQNKLKNRFILAFQEQGVDASDQQLKQMPDLISQLSGNGCTVVVSETEPVDAPEGTIWIMPINIGGDIPEDSSSSTVPEDSSSSIVPEEPSNPDNPEQPSDSSSSDTPVEPDVPDAPAQTVINISGAIQPRFNGDYVFNSSTNRYEQNSTEEHTRYIEWVASRNTWCIVEIQSGYYLYTDLGGTEGDISSITGTKSVMINGEPIDGCTITITVTEGGSSGGSTSNADYVISGATSQPELNGEYIESGTYNGKPMYVNTSNSNATIKYDNMLGWSVFYYSQPKYYTNNTTDNVPPVTGWNGGLNVSKGSTTAPSSKSFKELVRVSPTLETIESEISTFSFSVGTLPSNTTDSVAIEWVVDGQVYREESDIYELNNITLSGAPSTHNIVAVPVVNGVKRTDKAVQWTVVLYATCIWCGHTALSDSGWPLCPSCGKFQ